MNLMAHKAVTELANNCDTGAQNLSHVVFVDFSCHHNPTQSLLHYSEIILGNKGFYSVSNKTNSTKIGLQLYSLWQIHGHQLN